MKYYYKIFVSEGIENSLKFIKVTEEFIKELTESSNFKFHLEQNMEYFYVSYDVEQIIKGKPSWTWCTVNDYYKVNYTYKGDVRPTRPEKIKKLKMLWDNEE
jgi:hypothetical protein